MMKRKYTVLRKLKGAERMSVGIFWSECAVQVISYLCAVVVMTMVLSLTLPVSTEKLTRIVHYVAYGMIFVWCIPIVRNTRRRLRDAGYSAKAYLWLLLPFVGWLVFVVLLCKKGSLQRPEECGR